MVHTARTTLLACALVILMALIPVQTRAQTQPPDPRFGIVEAFVNADAATQAGAGYTRIILRWDVIQPAGPADWKPANVPDPFVAAELAAGRQVVGLLIGTPAWAADPAKGLGAAEGARAVPKMADWAAFCRRMAQHYRGRITHWIIWNEPDVWEAGHPGNTWAGSEGDYFALLKTAYLAIKDVNPALQVHLAGLTYFWDWSHGRRQYLDRLLDAIVADPEAPAHGFYFDAVVYHLYFKPLQAPQVIGEARQMLGRHGIDGKPIWINETNAPPSDDLQEPPWSKPRYQITQAEQAAFIIQELALAFAGGAQRVEVYKLRNSADHPESIEPFGLLRADDGRRPAFTAYQVATTYMRDFRTARLQRQGDIFAVTFDRGPQSTTVLWTMGRTGTQVAVTGAADRASLVDEQGQVKDLTASQGQYVISLPGAACTNGADCFIGGAPRLLVQKGPATGQLVLPGATGPVSTAGAAPAAGGETNGNVQAPVRKKRPEHVPEGPGF
jgi:hypothetical protein